MTTSFVTTDETWRWKPPPCGLVSKKGRSKASVETGGVTGGRVSLTEIANEAAHDEFASLDAILTRESGGGKRI